MVENVRGIYFPYCIEKQEDETWILLNRNYKPIGFNTSEFIDYKKYPVSIKLSNIKATTLKKLSCNDDTTGNRIYLYNDGNIPTSSDKAMKEYLDKLEILLKLQNA